MEGGRKAFQQEMACHYVKNPKWIVQTFVKQQEFI